MAKPCITIFYSILVGFYSSILGLKKMTVTHFFGASNKRIFLGTVWTRDTSGDLWTFWGSTLAAGEQFHSPKTGPDASGANTPAALCQSDLRGIYCCDPIKVMLDNHLAPYRIMPNSRFQGSTPPGAILPREVRVVNEDNHGNCP